MIPAEITKKVYDSLLNRGAIPFVEDSISAERDFDEDEENEEALKEFFTDIMEMKKEIVTVEKKISNFVVLDEIETLEEKAGTKKTIVKKKSQPRSFASKQ
jgi:hypothetical protein